MGSGERFKSGEGDIGRWSTIGEIEGIKIVADSIGNPDNLLTYSNTSNAYFSQDKNGEISQIRLYNEKQSNHKDPIMDVDFFQEKEHTNPNNIIMPPDVAHVHIWEKNDRGKWKRSKEARLLTDTEIKKWGDIFKKAYPKIKFR